MVRIPLSPDPGGMDQWEESQSLIRSAFMFFPDSGKPAPRISRTSQGPSCLRMGRTSGADSLHRGFPGSVRAFLLQRAHYFDLDALYFRGSRILPGDRLNLLQNVVRHETRPGLLIELIPGERRLSNTGKWLRQSFDKDLFRRVKNVLDSSCFFFGLATQGSWRI